MAKAKKNLTPDEIIRLHLQAVRAEAVKRDQERQAKEVELRGEEIRHNCTSLLGFVREAWHILEPAQPYVEGMPIQAMAEHLEAVHFGQIKRLLTNVPPGTMKSLLHNVFFPAWEWGAQAMPATRYLNTSYTSDLTIRDSLKFKALIESSWYQSLWGDRVQKGSPWHASLLTNEATGFRQSTAFTHITGKRANRVILDDPISVAEANSEHMRNKILGLFREAVPNRLNDRTKDVIMVVMQRLHQSDISGYIIDHLKDQYTCLVLPMEYEPKRKCVTHFGGKTWEDPRTKKGELLFPERFPKAELEEDRITMTDYAWAGQMQQEPVPREGGLFKSEWTKARVGKVPAGSRMVKSWDFASSQKQQGFDPDATAYCKMAKTPDDHFIIVRVEQDWKNAASVELWVKEEAEKDGRRVAISIPKDPGQAGASQGLAYAKALSGYNVTAIPRSTDKEACATPLSTQFQLGNVSILETGDPKQDAWITPFLEQLTLFPAANHDDMVDACSDAFIMLNSTKAGQGYRDFVKAQKEAAEKQKTLKELDGINRITMRPPKSVKVQYVEDGDKYKADSRGLFIIADHHVEELKALGWVQV